MKVKIEPVDYFFVEAAHSNIHAELKNWALCVHVKRQSWVHPMWKGAQSNGRQWYAPVLKTDIDTLGGMETEKAVRSLPEKHRQAIRWSYVYKWAPATEIRRLGVTYDGLFNLIRSGRTMLINRKRMLQPTK
jgi:hypothetical protein